MTKDLLIVEDEFLIRDLLENFAQKKGLTYDSVETLQSAFIAMSSSSYQVIITDNDLTKNGNEGVAILKLAKEKFPHTLRVMISGNNLNGQSQYIHYFEPKPFRPEVFFNQVIRLIKNRK